MGVPAEVKSRSGIEEAWWGSGKEQSFPKHTHASRAAQSGNGLPSYSALPCFGKGVREEKPLWMKVNKTGHQGPSTQEGDVVERPADTEICHTVESVGVNIH